MEPPKDVTVIESHSSTSWFDQDGIFCSVSKKIPPMSLEETKVALKAFKETIGDRKVCLLIDISNSGESKKEVRDYVALEFPQFIKAIAMISGSELGKMVANLFFNLKHQPYPTKMFTNEREAKEWLKQYL